MPAKAKHGTLNVHRADCDRKHANPCEPWEKRLPKLIKYLNGTMRCSSYSFQECLPSQAQDITVALGWATPKNPAFWWDENQNVVALDRKKYTDIETREISLWSEAEQLGNRNRRSVNWIKVRHIESGVELWLGSGHLETGDPEARIEQAEVLASHWPKEPAILGIDRNSYTLSKGAPRWILRQAGIEEVIFENQSGERSFNGFGTPVKMREVFDKTTGLNKECIDGLHVTGVKVRTASLFSTAGTGATDHSGIVVGWEL